MLARAIAEAPVKLEVGVVLTHDLALRCVEIACKYRLYCPEAYIDKVRKVISIYPVVE